MKRCAKTPRKPLMTSSTNSPFKLEALDIAANSTTYFVPHHTWYARFVLADTKRIAELTSWRDKIGVVGFVELAQRSWLNPDKIGSSRRIGNFSVRVEVSSEGLLDYALDFEDALWFACRELNPMLETFTTLFGIKNDIDIVVEHGLRPVNKLLHNIVQPFRQTTPKGRFTL
jgi:hypothetical protein